QPNATVAVMSKQSFDGWYRLSFWRRRRRLQLQAEPFCRICRQQGRDVVADTVDHVTPHRGDLNLFKLGELQSLCESCHNGSKQFVERHGYDKAIGLDGMPIDRRHPAYTGKLTATEPGHQLHQTSSSSREFEENGCTKFQFPPNRGDG